MITHIQFLPGQGLLQSYYLPQLCVVGKEFNPGVTTWPEGTIFNYDARGCHLLLSYKHPLKPEIDSFSDTARFALLYKYGTIILTFKLGDLPWQDAPYSYWLNPQEARPDPVADLNRPENRLFLHCFLINAATGILEDMRVLTFSPEFTTQLLECVKEQAEIPSTPEQHSDAVARIYSQYGVPKAMVRDALVKCRGGD